MTLTLSPYPGLVACSVWDDCIKPACLEVCEPLTLRRFSETQLQSSVYWLLYCAAFIPQWQQLGFHFTKGERLCIVWFFLFCRKIHKLPAEFSTAHGLTRQTSVNAPRFQRQWTPFIYQPYFSPPLRVCGRGWIYLSAMTPRY